MFPFSKKNFQNKKEKKKKAGTSRRTIAKPKGNGISPEGWQGNAEQQPGEATLCALPLCRNAFGWVVRGSPP